jgi:histidyl-tRNA synthetase
VVQQIVAEAPAMTGYLGEASAAHFAGLERLLRAAGISYTINPKLVRGLDYYNLTVFEWISEQLGAQGTVCGGGRYDGLFELLGGKPTPAAGFAMGNERLMALLLEGKQRADTRLPHAYVLYQGEGTAEAAVSLAEGLRAEGFRIVMHAGGGSFKSQMRKADASGASCALIIGEEELAREEVSLKFLRKDGEQQKLKRHQVPDYLRRG